MILEHYSRAPVGIVESRPQFGPEVKPAGFWISVKGPDDWPSWCRGEDFALHRLAFRHRVVLAESANVLTLSTAHAVEEFDRRFGCRFRPHIDFRVVDWPSVAERWDGVIIAPYQWSLRLRDPTWYYGWDCASGCIWNAAAIAGIELVETSDA